MSCGVALGLYAVVNDNVFISMFVFSLYTSLSSHTDEGGENIIA